MTQAVAFTTPGLIPLEAFMTFGVNAKPNSTNPFGYFGTGLKYAIAVCLRNGCSLVLWRGNDKFTFYVRQADFRGKDFGFVRMKRERWLPGYFAWGGPKYDQLPFTTELGKNWELWQAFRELETNTRDEGGRTYLYHGPTRIPDSDGVRDYADIGQDKDRTTILVTGSRFVDEFHEMDRHFLPDGKTVREDKAIQVIDRPSKSIYYRGVRIMDLKEESEFTYNFLQHIDLTEDRTAKYPWLLEAWIADYIAENEDEEFVERAVSTRRWEGRGLSYAYASATPSRAFIAAAPKIVNPTAKQYWDGKDPSVPTTTTIHLVVAKPDITANELMDIGRVVAEYLGLNKLVAKNTATDEEVEFDAAA